MNSDTFDIFDPSSGHKQNDVGTSQLPDAGGANAVRPPRWGVPALGFEVLVALLCFIPGTRIVHWIGYVIGALVVSATAVLYRIEEHKRRRSASFVTVPGQSTMVVAALICGIATGALHAYYIAQTHSVAPW